MPRDSSGTYSLPSSVNPVQSGTTITSNWGNTTLNDIKTEITNSLDRGGRGGMTAVLRGVDGTVSAPAFSWTSDTDSGFYRTGANNIALSLGGVRTVDFLTTTAVKAFGGGSGDGIEALGGALDGRGIVSTGVGTSAGVRGLGGNNGGEGVWGTGGTLNGSPGVKGTSSATNGPGGSFQGSGTGDGVTATGGATGAGITATGGSTSGAGIVASAAAGNSNGGTFQGFGSGKGVNATGGATGAGGNFVGGSTSGAGIVAAGSAGNANGGTFTGNGSGYGVDALGDTAAGGYLHSNFDVGGKFSSVNGAAIYIVPRAGAAGTTAEGYIWFDSTAAVGQKLKIYMDGATKYINVT